ncbi:hypothetical protein BGC_01050 [Burkholderia sp. 3C]
MANMNLLDTSKGQLQRTTDANIGATSMNEMRNRTQCLDMKLDCDRRKLDFEGLQGIDQPFYWEHDVHSQHHFCLEPGNDALHARA